MANKYNKAMGAYYKDRYNNDEEFRKRHIGHVLKYLKTTKGKISHTKARKKYCESGKYLKLMRVRRAEAKKKGVCTRCFKRKVIQGTVSCSICLDYYKRRNKNDR